MNRLVFVLLVGVGLAVGARSFADVPKQSDKTVEVLVAKRDISVHVRISHPEKDFVSVAFPKSAAPEDPASLDYLKGRVLRRSIRKGDCIRKSDLYGDTKDIPEGLMAVGIPIAPKNMPMPALELPGKRVDIILHIEKRPTPYTVLKNALVVAADSQPNHEGPNRLAEMEIITLAVSKADALKLINAKEIGILQLVIPKQVDIIVANRDLAIGEILDQPTKQFAKKSLRKDETPKGAILSLDDLKGRTLKRPIREGAAVTKEDLLGRDEKSGIAIPDGHRAYALRIRAYGIPLFGLASLPGARVSLVHTTNQKDQYVHKVMVEDVLVLAADVEPVGDEKVHIVTFAVTPETASQLEALRDSGTFSIVLRRGK